MNKNRFRKIISICMLLLLCIPSVIPIQAREEQKQISEMTLQKRIDQIGDAKDRIYRVQLSIDGEQQSFVRDAEIFILLDLQAQMAANYGIWSYYLRSVYNMCDELLTTHPDRTFHFHFIAYNDGEDMVLSETIRANKANRNQTLGNIDSLYVDGDGNPIYSKGQMFRYYKNPTEYQSGTLLDYFQQISPKGIPGNVEAVHKNERGEILGNTFTEDVLRMEYQEIDGKVCLIPKEPAEYTIRAGEKDTTGMLFSTKDLPYVNQDAGKYFTNGVNTSAALREVKQIIENNHLQRAQVVLLNDSFPNVDRESHNAYNGDRKVQVEVTKRFYDLYEEMKKQLGIRWHMFAYDIYEAHQFPVLWDEYTSTVGNNLLREGENTGGYYDGTEYIPFTNWSPPPGSLYQNRIEVLWDHNLGANSDEEQLAMARDYLNQSMLHVSEKVGNGIESSDNYAYFTKVEDAVAKQFHILKEEGYEPVVKGVFHDAYGNENSVELEHIWPEYENAESQWQEQKIKWNLGTLSADYEQYLLVFYIQANEDYFGGEVLKDSEEALIRYLTYQDWFENGKPEEENECDQDDFQIRTFEETTTYVPWFVKSQDGQGTIFYGDSARLLQNETCQGEPFVTKASNETTNPEILYYLQDDWKDRNGKQITFQKKWEIQNAGDEQAEILEIENPSITVVPDDNLICRYYIERAEGEDYGQAGMWEPVYREDLQPDYARMQEFQTFTKKYASVEIKVEKGSLVLSKILQSDTVSPKELEQLYVGFPVEIKGNGDYLQTIIRQQEGKSIVGLKRGIYTLREIVPQTFSFEKFKNETDHTENLNAYYQIRIGFDDETERIYQNQNIAVQNRYERPRDSTSILEVKNQFLTQ